MAGLLDPIPGTMSQQERDLRLKLNDFETPAKDLLGKHYDDMNRATARVPAPGQVGTTTLTNIEGLRKSLLARGIPPNQVEQMIQQYKMNQGLK